MSASTPKPLVRPTVFGRLESVVGQHATVTGLELAVGDVVEIGHLSGTSGEADGGIRLPVRAEIVAASRKQATALPFGTLSGPRPRGRGPPFDQPANSRRSPAPGSGARRHRPPDGRADRWPITETVTDDGTAPDPLSRPLVEAPLQVGVRAIDGLIPVGVGQRTGIFAGSGVGKSSLLSMLIRGTSAPVRVLALIGERGREVREFLERDLGPEGLGPGRSSWWRPPSSLPWFAAGPPLSPPASPSGSASRAPTCCCSWDSLTRFAMAHREIGLAAGEMPTSRGYPPSIPATLSMLLERAGTTPSGSITGIYTVLVEGDDDRRPDRRHRPLAPRWPHRVEAVAGGVGPLPRRRHPVIGQPGRPGRHNARGATDHDRCPRHPGHGGRREGPRAGRCLSGRERSRRRPGAPTRSRHPGRAQPADQRTVETQPTPSRSWPTPCGSRRSSHEPTTAGGPHRTPEARPGRGPAPRGPPGTAPAPRTTPAGHGPDH